MKKVYLTTALCAAAGAALPAPAATMFADRAAFASAAGSLSTETFESCDGGAVNLGPDQTLSAATPGPCTTIVAGVTFAPDPGSGNYIAYPGQSANSSFALGVDSLVGGHLRVVFDGTSTAFGADLFQNENNGAQNSGSVAFLVSTFTAGHVLLDTFSVAVAPQTGSFFGFVSARGFQRVEISEPGGYAVIDEVSFSAPGAVPEPEAWAMLVAGFGLTGAVLRRRDGRPSGGAAALS